MLKTGFFDSINGDRKYNSRDIATMFDGIIVDGIYAQIGERFSVNVDEEDPMTIIIGTGQAWLSHTKILNTSPYRIKFDPVSSTTTYTIVIEVNEPDRTAEISYINENKEFIKNNEYIHQYRLAYVKIIAGATKITQSNVESKIGFAIPNGIPYVTCPLDPFPADETLKQWVAQWTEFYEGANVAFEGDQSAREKAFNEAQTQRENDFETFRTLFTNWLNSTETDWNTWYTGVKAQWDELQNAIDISISEHNESNTAHSDIRELISDIVTRLNTLADSDDTTLDQLSEVVAYIKDNRELIDSITTSKVSVSDIVDNLTSSYTDKPLSANQGKVLKNLIAEVDTKMTISYALKTSVEDLKKSVSDGKILVANAITEKGVETATNSSFATMAENISQIETGGNGEDTNDATAVPENVLENETFYGQNGKEVGTMPNNGSIKVGLLLKETYTIPEGYHDGNGKVKVLHWKNNEDKEVETSSITTYSGSTGELPLPPVVDATYKFEQSGDRWIANNRGVDSSIATSTWTVTVSEPTIAYIGYRTATEEADKLSIILNGETILYVVGGNMESEGILILELVAGENTLTATYRKDSSEYSYGDMAYVILPPIGEQPGQYNYQSKLVTPTSSPQTVYADSGFDGLSSVTVGAASSSDITICDNLGGTSGMTAIPEGYKAYVFIWIVSGGDTQTIYAYGTKDTPGYLLSKSGRFGSGNIKACYSLSFYDGTIGGSTPVTKRSDITCYGLK